MRAWTTFLREQRATGFAAFAGAQVSMTLPISDAVLSSVFSALLRRSGSIRRVSIRTVTGGILRMRVSLARPSFFPEIPFELQIERQPTLPTSALVVFKILSLAGLPGGAAFLLTLLNGLPAGVSLRGDLIEIDLAVLLRLRGEEALRYITRLNIATVDGMVVLFVDAGVPPSWIDPPTISVS